MPGLGQIRPREVKNLGETPAQARARMEAEAPEAAEVEQPRGTEVEGLLTPAHMAIIREQEEGFGETDREDGPPQELTDLAEPPTPSKAMDTIRQLSQDKIQLQSELDAALQLVNRYRRKFGELD